MVKNEIKVFARLKPESREKNTVNYQICRRPKKNIQEDYLVLNGEEKSCNDYINNRPDSWNFAFHQIFDRDISQDEIFNEMAKPIVQSVLNGYNATIFAYGQTGSGKTYSITGDTERYEDRGVIPRTVQYLFETIKKNPDNFYSVEIAYLEIYNENGYDLLDPKHDVVTKLEDLPRVTIREDENGALHLKNLSFRIVENETEALALLFSGDANRAISETPMNPQSSRSHCIFTIAVTVKESGSDNHSKAKIHLVDLAGSERVYKCCISGNILTEAKYINLSLHYLEQVIVCLGQPNVSHIPYRNSLLTAILRDSLGGNCLTAMLATLSLSTSNLEETISTCRFSQRVALIKNDVNLVLARNTEDENKLLRIEIERLRRQITLLTGPHLAGELTAKEKHDLDKQVDNFLRSMDVTIDWGRDDRKVHYCMANLREKLKRRHDEYFKLIQEPEKDLNYYRNLVFQRDREISALIEMLKRTSKESLKKSTTERESFETNDFRNETSSTISMTTKKVRLKNLMAEARSVAELIKIGKASIGDLKKRISEANLGTIEAQTLYKNLEKEQSKLGNNLNRLKTLKSETTELKNGLISSQEKITIPNYNESSSNIFTNRIETDQKKSSSCTDFKNFDSSQARILPIPGSTDESTRSANDRFEELPRISSPNYARIEEDVKANIFPTNKSYEEEKRESDETKMLRSIEVESNGDRDRDRDRVITDIRNSPNLTKPVSVQIEIPNPDSQKPTEINVKKCQIETGGDGDSRLNLSIENSTGTNIRLVNEFNEPLQNVMERNFRDLKPRSEKEVIVYSPRTIPNAPEIGNFSNNQFADFDPLVTGRNFTSSESTIAQENLQKFIPSKFADDRLHKRDKITDDEESFIKSLPLTGDPEIDEEIIAFYRAKRSGGNY